MVGRTARLLKLCRYVGPAAAPTLCLKIVFSEVRNLFVTFSELSSKLCWATFRNIKLSGFDEMFIISLFHYRVRGFMMLSSSLGNSFFPSSWHFRLWCLCTVDENEMITSSAVAFGRNGRKSAIGKEKQPSGSLRFLTFPSVLLFSLHGHV